MDEYIKPSNIQCTKNILNQMENSIYLIKTKNNNFGLAFFSYINCKNNNIPVLIANNDIINEQFKYDSIQVFINNSSKTIELGDIRYVNIEFNITIIEIKQNQKNKVNFLEFDDVLYEKEPELYYLKESVYFLFFNNQGDILVSYNLIHDADKSKILYKYKINLNSRYSIFFNLTNNKIIGLNENNSSVDNKGILFNTIIKEFINKAVNFGKYDNNKNKDMKNEIEISIKVEEKDLNKEIYFLSNKFHDLEEDNYINNNDNSKETNKFHTELFINDIPIKYKKYFIPKKVAKYTIKLKFKFTLKDCSYMFSRCENIIDINFKFFNTKSIFNMKRMFNGCVN